MAADQANGAGARGLRLEAALGGGFLAISPDGRLPNASAPPLAASPAPPSPSPSLLLVAFPAPPTPLPSLLPARHHRPPRPLALPRHGRAPPLSAATGPPQSPGQWRPSTASRKLCRWTPRRRTSSRRWTWMTGDGWGRIGGGGERRGEDGDDGARAAAEILNVAPGILRGERSSPGRVRARASAVCLRPNSSDQIRVQSVSINEFLKPAAYSWIMRVSGMRACSSLHSGSWILVVCLIVDCKRSVKKTSIGWHR